MTRPRQGKGRTGQRGEALAVTLHVVLLVLVLGQVVYLGSRHRLRFDATSDDQFSVTDSTRTIVAGLDKRLLIEAYLSPKADMPASLRDTRTVLDNFLDELVELGQGKIAVQRFNPLDDKTLQDKCARIGVAMVDAPTSTGSALEGKRLYQGLRLVYGGGRQKVLDKIGPSSTFQAEAVITPAIKEVVTATRKKIGYMEWQVQLAAGQQAPRGIGWSGVRKFELVQKRYDFQNCKDAEGALVADDIDTLMLFRPMDLSDRQKYVVDQFLMRGGSLVVFADVADYAVAPRRQFQKQSFLLDAKDSRWHWQEQLYSYGIALSGKLVADLSPDACAGADGQEFLGLPTPVGYVQPLGMYPYFFHCVAQDWALISEQLARFGGRNDATLADYYKKSLRPGIDSEEFLFQAWKRLRRGPGFYWPCEVDLRRKQTAPDLPPGVDGRVLLWSSPLTLLEEPPPSLDALGSGDRTAQAARFNEFLSRLGKRIESEPRQQAGLMVELHGPLPSYCVGKERPKRPAELREEAARKAATDQAATDQAATDQANAAAEGDDPKAATTPDAPKDAIGPEPPKEPAPAAASTTEPEPLLAARSPGRIVVIGDSDFIRDDFIGGNYQPLGGPVSLYGQNFFLMLVDWLSQDSDLLALQSRGPIDRRLQLAPGPIDRVEDPRDTERRLAAKTSALVWANVATPCFLLFGLGIVVLIVRRTQKRQFLASIGN